MEGEPDPFAARLGEIAGRQHGVVTTAQVWRLGISKRGFEGLVHSGRLRRLHRGVYAVGHRASSREATWMAAVLACGDGAVLSHASAAVLWALLKPMSGSAHVSLPSRSGRASRPGIRIHRPRSLPRTSVTKRNAIPVTTPARTLTDLTTTNLEPRLIRAAIREAAFRGYRVDPRILARTRRTRSDLELDFLVFCRRHDLPPPEVNVRVGRFTADFLYRDARLVIETDSWEYHGGEVAFEEDRERDLALRAAGFEPLRLTGRQLEREGGLAAAEIRRRLGEGERRLAGP